MSDLTTHSIAHTARTETLPPADGAKGDAKTQALKGRSATLDTGVLSRLGRQDATTTGNSLFNGIGARSVQADRENPGPQRIAQAPHDGKSDVEVLGKGGVAAKGAEPTYANAKAQETQPQYANAGLGKGEIESGYSVLKQEPQYANAGLGKGEIESGYSVLKPEEQSTQTRGTGSARSESGDYAMLDNALYVSADKTGSKPGSKMESKSVGEDAYLTPRSDAGSRGTFRNLSDRMASVGNAPPQRLARLKAAVQKLFAAVKSLASRVAQVRSRPASQPPRIATLGAGESWRNPTAAQRTLPPTPNQPSLQPSLQRGGTIPSDYESRGAVPSNYESGGAAQQVRSQTPVSVDLSMTERYEERLMTDMRNLGDADKATVRRLASEIDTITLRADTLDIELTDSQELQILQHRHDIALVLENHTRQQGGGDG